MMTDDANTKKDAGAAPGVRNSGEVRQNADLSFSTVIRTWTKRETFRLPTCTTWDEANARSAILGATAKRFRDAGVNRARGDEALKILAAASTKALGAAVRVCEDLLGGLIPVAGVEVPTFQSVAEDWTGGKLARDYPDQVKVKRTVDDDISRLKNHVYPIIGSTRIDRVTLDQCEEIMRRLPSDMASATRRNVARTIGRVFKLAIYPLRHLEKSPIPEGFVPKAKQTRALAYLYPDEERRLLGCPKVPIQWRVFWGFLTREGMRESEALGLSLRDVDLERGAVQLTKNKTDDPRAWALGPDVVEVLRWYVETFRADAEANDRLFVDEWDRPMSEHGLARLLRKHLELAGLKETRPELFKTTEHRLRIRVHDLRGVFVTVALANGKTESWISDRTGHRSSQMIAKYKRMARTFAELALGPLTDLSKALPEWTEPEGDCHSLPLTGRRGWDSNPRLTVLQTVA